MHGSDLLLVRIQLLAWRRGAAAFCAGSGWNRIVLFGGGTLALAYVLGLARQKLMQAAPYLLSQQQTAEPIGAACIALLGLMAGYGAANRVARDAFAPWLAPLPWPVAIRRRAMRLAVLPYLCLALVALLPIVTMLVAWIDVALIARLDGTAAVIFSVCFALSGGIALHRARAAPATRTARERPVAPFPRYLSWADRGTPCWVGTWALGERVSGVTRIWLVLLGTLGLVGAAGSFETRTAIPGSLVGLVGGHAIFLFAMRARPLRAPALVVQPVPLWRAAWATTRLPLLLSFAWMAVPGFAAIIAAPAHSDPVAGAAGFLLLLDGLFAFITFSLADAPGSALLLQSVAVVMAVQNYAKLGNSEIVFLLGFVGLLWSRATRRFTGRTRHAGRRT